MQLMYYNYEEMNKNKGNWNNGDPTQNLICEYLYIE